METAQDYLSTWKSAGQGNPYDLNNSGKFFVTITDETEGSYYSEVIWGENADQISNDLTPYLKDPECITRVCKLQYNH